MADELPGAGGVREPAEKEALPEVAAELDEQLVLSLTSRMSADARKSTPIPEVRNSVINSRDDSVIAAKSAYVLGGVV